MGAALTIAILLMVSLLIIKVATVAMRLTGLPETVARFQCISALTGTGFTTTEAEMIVNYPIRRRIVITLMVVGNFGIVSVSSTFIVAFIGIGAHGEAILFQALMILFAVIMTFVIMLNQSLDRFLSKITARILSYTTDIEHRGFHRVFQVSDGYSISEHAYKQDVPTTFSAMDHNGLTLLAIQSVGSKQTVTVDADYPIGPGDILVYFGHDKAHEEHAKQINPQAASSRGTSETRA